MADINAIIVEAQRLRSKDEEALALEIGLRFKQIENDPGSADDPNLAVAYGTHMGLIDDLKALGWRILMRWNKELFSVVCAERNQADEEVREKILTALRLDEAALIAAVAPVLIWVGAPAAISAAVAPLIVKKFIIPAKQELCAAWSEAITAHQ